MQRDQSKRRCWYCWRRVLSRNGLYVDRLTEMVGVIALLRCLRQS
jgi:hypothetical protein